MNVRPSDEAYKKHECDCVCDWFCSIRVEKHYISTSPFLFACFSIIFPKLKGHCSSGGRAAHLLTAMLMVPCLAAQVSLGKVLNPKLLYDVSIGVSLCMNVKKELVPKNACMNG